VVIIIAVKFQAGGPNYQFTESVSWIAAFGVHYAVGVDGIALVLIAMTAVLMPVVLLASWNDAEGLTALGDGPAGPRHSVKTYFALMMVLETMMIGIFAATDVFLFYVFFEAMLIPMYFMISSYGTGKRQYAAVKFLLYSLLGGLLMLVAIIALYVCTAHPPRRHQDYFPRKPSPSRTSCIGFAVRPPPSAGSAALSCGST
jgi:NADH-quinone oxidoreductase subunit M